MHVQRHRQLHGVVPRSACAISELRGTLQQGDRDLHHPVILAEIPAELPQGRGRLGHAQARLAPPPRQGRRDFHIGDPRR